LLAETEDGSDPRFWGLSAYAEFPREGASDQMSYDQALRAKRTELGL
jgi:hypothetical protein